MIAIKNIDKKGKGIISINTYKKGDVILANYVILVDKQTVKHSIISDYLFEWNKNIDCIALGLISLVNHSSIKNNCTLKKNKKDQTISLIAIKDIELNEELLINYDCQLWFKEF